MAIANRTCVSFCYQPKAHYLATSRESRRYVVAYSRFVGAACRHLAMSRESKAHFGFPWVRPWTIAVNVTWLERGFNACQTPRSMYPSIFNRLRAIARYWSEIATFSYPLAFNAPVGGVPIGIPGKRLVLRKLESWGYHYQALAGSKDSLTIGWAVSTRYQRVPDGRKTDGQTDGQTSSL